MPLPRGYVRATMKRPVKEQKALIEAEGVLPQHIYDDWDALAKSCRDGTTIIVAALSVVGQSATEVEEIIRKAADRDVTIKDLATGATIDAKAFVSIAEAKKDWAGEARFGGDIKEAERRAALSAQARAPNAAIKRRAVKDWFDRSIETDKAVAEKHGVSISTLRRWAGGASGRRVGRRSTDK